MLAVNKKPTPVRLTLSLNRKITILSLLFLSLLLHLGFWQLERAQEKNLMQQKMDETLLQPRINLSGTEKNIPLFRRVELQGEFKTKNFWLIDNRVHHGRVGYEVVAPYTLKNNVTVLVNLGWVPAPVTRDLLPQVDLPLTHSITGRLYQPSSNNMVRNVEVSQTWPRRVQELSFLQAAEDLGTSVYPAVLRINGDDPSAFIAQWRWLNSSADKHYGYAVQWFLMAVVLCIAWLLANSNLSIYIKTKFQK